MVKAGKLTPNLPVTRPRNYSCGELRWDYCILLRETGSMGPFPTQSIRASGTTALIP